MELHPEVRNILPELQEVDSQRSRAGAFRARVGLGSQDWGATCQEKQMCGYYSFRSRSKNTQNSLIVIYMQILDQICSHISSVSTHMV